MRRLNLVSMLLGLLLAAFGPAAAVAAEKMDVVYHLSDVEKTTSVLGNIRNHIKGVGGPGNVHIVLVIHGPAGAAFQDISATDQVREAVAGLMKDGVEFDMCRNTMKAMGVDTKDLLPGFQVAEQGGVVRIAELQKKGYVYIRP